MVNIVIVLPAGSSLKFLVDKVLSPVDVNQYHQVAHQRLDSEHSARGVGRSDSSKRQRTSHADPSIPFLKLNKGSAEENAALLPLFLMTDHGQRRKLGKTPSTAGMERSPVAFVPEEDSLSVPDWVSCYILTVTIPELLFEDALFNSFIRPLPDGQFYETIADLDLNFLPFDLKKCMATVRPAEAKVLDAPAQRELLTALLAAKQSEVSSIKAQLKRLG